MEKSKLTQAREVAMKLLGVKFALVAVGLLAITAIPLSASYGRPLGKVNKITSFDIRLSENGSFSVLRLTGTAEGLGDCTGYGELDVVHGEQNTFDGTGIVAFTAANGDMLVGVVTVQRDNVGAISAEVHWRDSVTFHDGTTVASSGRFENHRPAGLRMSYCCCNCVYPFCSACAGAGCC